MFFILVLCQKRAQPTTETSTRHPPRSVTPPRWPSPAQIVSSTGVSNLVEVIENTSWIKVSLDFGFITGTTNYHK